MPTCPNAGQCPILLLVDVRALEELRLSYCDAKFERCERLRRGRDRRIVPMNLLPDGQMLGAAGPVAAALEPRRR